MLAQSLLSEHKVRDPYEVAPALTISDRETAPAWTEELARQLAAFLDLETGWDSYCATAPRLDAVAAAYELVMMLASIQTPPPQAVPTIRGGVQLEWHDRGIDLEVEVHSPFRFEVFYQNARTGEVREEDLMTDLRPLRNWIELLSE